jgi:small subunit ribosomal protein S18
VDGVPFIDYKDPAKLRRFLSERARIEPRRKTGTCAMCQRALTIAIKRARHLALLPYVGMIEREPFAREPRRFDRGPRGGFGAPPPAAAPAAPPAPPAPQAAQQPQ